MPEVARPKKQTPKNYTPKYQYDSSCEPVRRKETEKMKVHNNRKELRVRKKHARNATDPAVREELEVRLVKICQNLGKTFGIISLSSEKETKALSS